MSDEVALRILCMCFLRILAIFTGRCCGEIYVYLHGCPVQRDKYNCNVLRYTKNILDVENGNLYRFIFLPLSYVVLGK